jgi:hypothetical protein
MSAQAWDEDGGNGETSSIVRLFDGRIRNHGKRIDVLETVLREHTIRLDAIETHLGSMLVHIRRGEDAAVASKDAACKAADACVEIKTELAQMDARWQRFCDERHKHVDVRMESLNDEHEEVTGVHSPPEYLVQRIESLKSQLDSVRPKVERLDAAERCQLVAEKNATRAKRGRNAALITLGVTLLGVIAEALRQLLLQ